MQLFLTGLAIGLVATIINRRLLKKAFAKAEAVDPLSGYVVFNRLNFIRIALNVLVIFAAASRGMPAVLGAFVGLLTQMVFYIFDIIKFSRKG